MSGNVTNATVKSQTCELEDSRSNSKENRNQWKILKKNKSTNSERQINNNHNHHHHHHQRHHQFLHRHHHDVAAIIPKINENPKAECETLRTRAIVRIHQPPNLLTVAFGWYFLWAFLLSVPLQRKPWKIHISPFATPRNFLGILQVAEFCLGGHLWDFFYGFFMGFLWDFKGF